MAAGMWQGLLAGYQDVEEKKAAREAKEEELLEKRKGLAMQLAAKYGTRGFGGGASGGSSGEGTSGSPSSQGIGHLSQVLKQQYGVSDDAISAVAGAAGAGGLTQALEILDKTRDRFAQLGRDMPTDVVNNLFESAVLTGPETETLDFAKLEEYIGGALDPLERELISASRPSGGQAYFPSIPVVETPPLGDVELLEKRGLNAITQRATIEIRSLNNALNNIQKTEELETDPTKLREIAETKNWIIDRQARVKDALDSGSGDGGNPFGLVSLYGNEFLQQMFEADPRFSTAVLSPVFQEATSAAPKRVDSLPQLRNLARLGVIRVGDTVEILDPSTGEYVLQTIGE